MVLKLKIISYNAYELCGENFLNNNLKNNLNLLYVLINNLLNNYAFLFSLNIFNLLKFHN